MTYGERSSWEALAGSATGEDETFSSRGGMVKVDRRELKEITADLSRLIFASERQYRDSSNRLVAEYRDRLRQDLIQLNDVRIQLAAMLKNAS